MCLGVPGTASLEALEVETGSKVSKVAKIRNRYNQVPHLTKDTNGKVTNSQKTPQTPLVIRREELSVRQAIRIMMKLDEDHIKVSWDDSQEMVGLNIEYPFWKNECASG